MQQYLNSSFAEEYLGATELSGPAKTLQYHTWIQQNATCGFLSSTDLGKNKKYGKATIPWVQIKASFSKLTTKHPLISSTR